MAQKRLELTWHKSLKRWRKRYKGRDYYFAFGSSKGDVAGYDRALAAWREKKAELERAKPQQAQYSLALDTLAMMRDWYTREGDETGVRETAERIGMLQAALGTDNPPPLEQWQEPLGMLPPETRAIWADRFREINRHQSESKQEYSVDSNVATFLHDKRVKSNLGELSLGRLDNYRLYLHNFIKWFGGHKPLTAIDARALLDYRNHLMEQVNKGKISADYAADHITTLKQFVRHCWVLGLMELPRIMETKQLAITVPQRKLATFTAEEVAKFLSAAKDRFRLNLLLMLNCGYTQQVIADLRHDEVDWIEGRVIRKRSKTGTIGNVPVVNYRLWPETFCLLKQNRCKHPELVFITRTGKPLKNERMEGGKYRKTDNIYAKWCRLQKKLTVPSKPLKLFRKTGASKLAEHTEYKYYSQHYLGHSPRALAERHYVQPSQAEFDKAIEWLGKQFGQ